MRASSTPARLMFHRRCGGFWTVNRRQISPWGFYILACIRRRRAGHFASGRQMPRGWFWWAIFLIGRSARNLSCSLARMANGVLICRKMRYITARNISCASIGRTATAGAYRHTPPTSSRMMIRWIFRPSFGGLMSRISGNTTFRLHQTCR